MTDQLPWERFRALLVRDDGPERRDRDIDLNAEELLVARGVPSASTAGEWAAPILDATCRLPMTFYPSTQEHRSAFADKMHRHEAAIVKPSRAFWSWLVGPSAAHDCASDSANNTWQLRGTLLLEAHEVASLLGSAMSGAMDSMKNIMTLGKTAFTIGASMMVAKKLQEGINAMIPHAQNLGVMIFAPLVIAGLFMFYFLFQLWNQNRKASNFRHGTRRSFIR